MEILSRAGNVNYIVGNSMNNVRRSRYGRQLAQNQTREINAARNLVNATGQPRYLDMLSCLLTFCPQLILLLSKI